MKLCLVILCCVFIFSYGNCFKRNKNTSKDTSITYYTKQTRNITIPIMIHIDKALTKILVKEYKRKSRNKMKYISRYLLKEVERFFKQTKLSRLIKFKLMDTRFLRNNVKKLKVNGNASKYLKSYCNWQGEMKMMKKKWYYSVLLTGIDLYYVNNNKTVKSSTGRSYMGSVCSVYNSCTLLEWKPKSLAYLLAHEIGHSLGITHDGQGNNDCRNTKHIMTPKYNPLSHPRTWSTCSKRDLDMFLVSKKSWCLRPGSESQFNARLTKLHYKNKHSGM